MQIIIFIIGVVVGGVVIFGLLKSGGRSGLTSKSHDAVKRRKNEAKLKYVKIWTKIGLVTQLSRF
jgi:hypothetical protein